MGQLAYSFSTEEGKCIELAKSALAVADAAQIAVSGDAVFGLIESGDIVAYCVDGIEGYPVSIVIAGFGDAGGAIKEAVNAAEAYIERRSNEAVEQKMLEIEAQTQLKERLKNLPLSA